MKLRQAEKILKRISIEGKNNEWYDTPLPKSWGKLMCLWHKAQAVFNHHCIPVGRMANKWANEQAAKISKRTREEY